MVDAGATDDPSTSHIRRMDVQTAVVVTLDCSWEMHLEYIFDSMKEALLIFDDFLRTYFQRDFLHVVGFSAYARTIEREQLPDLRWDDNVLGTNMQAALRLAQQLLYPYTTDRREIIVLTGGEPTAHLEQGRSHFAYPPTPKTVRETLRAARDCSDAGIDVSLYNVVDRTHLLGEFCIGVAQMWGGGVVYTSPAKLSDAIRNGYALRRMEWP